VPIEPGSVVVVAGAPSYGPEALQEILEICRSAQASVVLLGTQRALERGRVLFEVAAMADGRLPGRADPLQPSFESLTCAWRSIGSVEVAVVGSLSHACDEAARRLDAAPSARTLSGPDGGGRPLLVAGDEAIVAALRSRPGVQSGDVVHTRDLKEVLAARTGEIPHLVVVGGASVLRQGATASPNVARSHVLVAPGIAPASVEALGRAAEAARPRYLTTPLGVPLTELDERQAWRTAASAIESYRDRWQITDGGRAYGAPVPSLQVGSEQAACLAALERRAAEVRGLGRARSGRQLDGPGLGLGR
jgi:hypothetical protein